jgi:type-F conjugative transfer system pilin assembly protein TrbC
MAKLHRQGLLWGYYGREGLCGKYPMPIIRKSQYRISMTYPLPQTDRCQPLGATETLWQSGREYPYKGEDFGYIVWRETRLLFRGAVILAAMSGNMSEVSASEATRLAAEIVRESVRQADSKHGEAVSLKESISAPHTPSVTPQKSCRVLRAAKAPSSPPKTGGGDFIVCVSFSLTDATLKFLHDRMTRLGGRLVMRGLLNNSFQQTRDKTTALGISVDIDPLMFDRYAVHRVPAYILREKEDGPVDQVSGNVDPLFVLDLFKEAGDLKNLAAMIWSKAGERS